MGTLLPLLVNSTGISGIILEVDWLLDFPLLWTGNASQPYPIISTDVGQWSGRSTYADVKALVGALRAAALSSGELQNVRVGLFFVGWASIYDTMKQSWSNSHPEIFLNNKPDYSLNHSAAVNPGLHADKYPYASQPGGATEGQNYFSLLAAQWSSLSAFLGADALVLRDGLSTFANYDRDGPWGSTPSSEPILNAAWDAAFRFLFSSIKAASPGTYLMGYSSAGSAVGETRIGRVDLEAIVSDGGIDAWIDQSWAGAWEDYYVTHMLGWTWQRSTILAHKAAIAGGNTLRAAAGKPPCVHIVLHETFDAYESWNTIMAVPQKLRWGVWAFQGASYVSAPATTTLYSPAAASYVSWSWSWHDQWMTDGEVNFLSSNIHAAAASLVNVTRRAGPRIVYNRAMLEHLDAGCTRGPNGGGPDTNCSAADNAGEWIDEQMAVVSKWMLPSGGVLRLDDAPTPALDPTYPEGYVLHSPGGNLSQASLASVSAILTGGKPVLVTGRSSLLHPTVLGALGVSLDPAYPRLLPAGMYAAFATPAALAIAPDMPTAFSLSIPPLPMLKNSSSWTPLIFLRDANGTQWPILVQSVFGNGEGGPLLWHPTDWLPGADGYGPWFYSNFGSTAPHYLIARYFQGAPGIPIRAATGAGWGASGIALDAWTSASDPEGSWVLMGNLEGQNRQWGMPGPVPADARSPRSIGLQVNLTALGVGATVVSPGACWALKCLDGPGGQVWNATSDNTTGSLLSLPPVYIEAYGGHAYRLSRC